MKMNTFATLALATGVAVGGCGRSKEVGYPKSYGDSVSRAAADSLEGPTRSVSSNESASIQGMAGMMGARLMTDSMKSQMRMIGSMAPERMKAMIPMHRRMVAEMLSSFDDAMRKMNMPADSAWTGLADSVRQDLVTLPGMSGGQLKDFMVQHHARLIRLMKMHEDMTASGRSR